MMARVGRVEISDMYYGPNAIYQAGRRAILAGGTVFREDHDPTRGVRVVVMEHPKFDEIEVPDDHMAIHDPDFVKGLPLYDVEVTREESLKVEMKRRADK